MHYWLFCAVTIYVVRCMVYTTVTLFLRYSTAQ